MTRELLVTIHAGSGIAGLLAGLAVFSPPRSREDRLTFRLGYGTLLFVLVVSLLGLIIVDWADLELGARLAFSGLTVLGLVMVARFILAHRLALSDTPDSDRRYVKHIYFTYVSLWVGFAILPALRSDSPGLWIPVAVIGVLGLGSFLIRRYERTLGVRA